jgi:hypothetical protein
VSRTSTCKSKFKAVGNSTVICTHLNKIYIWTYIRVIRHFDTFIYIYTVIGIAIVMKDNGSWILVFKNNAVRSFLALKSNGKIFLTRGKK